MTRIEIENKLLHEFKYLSLETLEKILDLVSLLRKERHTQKLVRHQPLFSEQQKTYRQANKALSLHEFLLQGPTLSAEECQLFEENRQWMELWEKFY